MKNIAIIGSGGAIGGAFIDNLSQRPEVKKIYAFSSANKEFFSPKVKNYQIDIEDEQSIKEAVQIVVKDNEKLDLVIVTIGMLHNSDLNIFPEKSLKDLKKEKFNKLFAVNIIAPALIAKHFLPQLAKDKKAVFAALSARVGSISDNHLGGWYAYRASKAALNMILKNAAIEIKRSNKQAIIVGLHPGTVDSKLSKPFQNSVAQEKLFSPDYSTKKLLEVIESLKVEDSGKIFAWDGEEIKN